MKTILVTGGAGYIGSKVSYDLKDMGYKVIIIDNLSTGYKKQIKNNFIFYKLDLKNYQKLVKTLKTFKIHAIFHFAGLTNVKESIKKKKKYYENNVISTINVLKFLKKYKINYLIFSSSAAVYGKQKSVCVKESDLKKPLSNYGRNKLDCEIKIKKFAKDHNFKFAILRYFNVIGPDQKMRCGPIKRGSLFTNISNSIRLKNYSINIYGNNYNTKDGTAIRDFIDVNDLSKLHILSLKKIKNKSLVLNCGYNMGYSVLQVVKTFNKFLNKKIKYKFKSRRLGDIGKIYADNNLLKKNFPNWKRKFNLDKSIKNIIKWEKLI